MAEGSSDRIRVLIADDHRMFRDLLRLALAAECEIVAEAEDGETTLATAIRTKPQVILLDVLMPGIGGLAAAHELARKIPGIRILVLSQYCDPEYVREALGEAGVAGYILKTDGAEEILPAIRAVHAGLRYLSPSIAPIVLDQMNRAPSERTETQRQPHQTRTGSSTPGGRGLHRQGYRSTLEYQPQNRSGASR